MAIYIRKNGQTTKQSGYSVSQDASDVTYDHTTSGLSATDVQDAIDEVAGDVDDIETALASILNTVTDIQLVNSLPQDASSHTSTLYLIREA